MNRLACAVLVTLALTATGCASAQAGRDPAGAVLAPPAPPPHIIPPVESEPAPPAPPAPAGPTPVVVRPSPHTAPPRADKSAEKPPEKTDAAPAVAVPAVPPGGAAQPPLQTTANVTELEGKIRALMAQASRDLDRTSYNALTAERRTQYDTAKRFIQQAEEALKVKNLVFAEQLADKAATLAAALVQHRF